MSRPGSPSSRGRRRSSRRVSPSCMTLFPAARGLMSYGANPSRSNVGAQATSTVRQGSVPSMCGPFTGSHSGHLGEVSVNDRGQRQLRRLTPRRSWSRRPRRTPLVRVSRLDGSRRLLIVASSRTWTRATVSSSPASQAAKTWTRSGLLAGEDLALIALAASVSAQEIAKTTTITPDALQWKHALSLPIGAQYVILMGDPTKAGSMVIQRLKLPPHYQVPAHTHPHARSKRY